VGFAKLPLGSRSLPSGKGSHREVTRAVAASAAASEKALIRPPLCQSFAVRSYANFTASLQTRCRTHAAALLAFVMTEALGSHPAPGTPSAKRSVGTRQAASMQDTLSEGTARDSAAGTFSGHRRRSRRTCHQRCGWPSLSGAERLVQRRVITHTPRLRRSSPATPRQPGIVAAKLPTRQHPRQPGNQGRAQHRLLIRLSPSEGRILQGVPRTALHALYLILKRMWHPQRIAL
jgi:hypothetical protein